MRARAGVVVAGAAVITLLIPSAATAAGTSMTLSGTAVRDPAPFDIPEPVCRAGWNPHRFRFDLHDQLGHDWVAEGSGCARVRINGNARPRGSLALRRVGSALPELIGKYRSASSGYKLLSRHDFTLKVRKEGRPPPREKAKGTLAIVENCAYDSVSNVDVCSATFSGTLTADSRFFS